MADPVDVRDEGAGSGPNRGRLIAAGVGAFVVLLVTVLAATTGCSSDDDARRRARGEGVSGAEEARKKTEEEAHRQTEEEARKKTEEEARRTTEEEVRRRAEEERRRAQEAEQREEREAVERLAARIGGMIAEGRVAAAKAEIASLRKTSKTEAVLSRLEALLDEVSAAEKKAGRRGPGPPAATLKLDIGGGVVMEMVYVKPGRFKMGSDSGARAQGPLHEVVITEGFYIGKYEVTQVQYEKVMAGKSSYFKGADRPADKVSWNDAVDFCQKLSNRTGGRIRLPTEAEWEYACRAGSTTAYSFGDRKGTLDEYAWYSHNAESRTHKVGQKRPNPWGIYDMHGNVAEWCADLYAGNYYERSRREDPTGPTSGSARVLRGGSWNWSAAACSSTNRRAYAPIGRLYFIGFRVVAAAPSFP